MLPNVLFAKKNKCIALALSGLLQPLHILEQVWEDLSMDFIEGLPKSDGSDSILVVVDQLSKYGHFIPIKHPFSAQVVASPFVRKVVRLHGMPRSIVTDRDQIFLSLFWTKLFGQIGNTLTHSKAYHPQTKAKPEVLSHCLKTYLHCYVSNMPR